LTYSIKGEVRPHEVKIRSLDEIDEELNLTILLKGKTKINKTKNSN
jgi:hypothetical protein